MKRGELLDQLERTLLGSLHQTRLQTLGTTGSTCMCTGTLLKLIRPLMRPAHILQCCREDGKVSFGYSSLRGKRASMEDFLQAKVGLSKCEDACWTQSPAFSFCVLRDCIALALAPNTQMCADGGACAARSSRSIPRTAAQWASLACLTVRRSRCLRTRH